MNSSAATTLWIDQVETPLGPLSLVSDGEALCMLEFTDRESRWRRYLDTRFAGSAPRPGDDPAGLSTRVRRYFEGELDALDGIEVRAAGTAFQQRVWTELRRVRCGETTSYSGLAERIGYARNAARAIGAANGANPVAIVVPCHRVIGAGGALTGYAGGVERKRWLLEHEGALQPRLA